MFIIWCNQTHIHMASEQVEIKCLYFPSGTLLFSHPHWNQWSFLNYRILHQKAKLQNRDIQTFFKNAVFSLTGLQKVNIAGLRLPSLERPTCMVGIWLDSRDLDFRRVFTIPSTDKNALLCLDGLYKWYGLCWTPALLLKSEMLGLTKKRVPIWLGPNKNIEQWLSNELPWWTTFLHDVITPC